MQGGGWCNSIASCSQRKLTPLGSSKYMETEVPFLGILSSDPSQNPGKLSNVPICSCSKTTVI